ncbi:leucyl aminopeptidase (aminopeptidase T) [Halanaerobium sp. MA284_MarDTE_T2]|nr:leucyl aminopeptidase (aminopeptidase T) [Halanaerobium sp. MA284_MarDTE_T2]
MRKTIIYYKIAVILNYQGGMKLSLKNLKKGAEIILKDCMNVGEKENLLIVSDFENKKVAEVLAEYGKELGAEAAVVNFFKRSSHGENPPEPAISALCRADAAVLAAVYSLTNSAARRKAVESGTRIISIPDCSEELFDSSALDVDFKEQKKIIDKIGNLMTEGKTISVSSEAGTDFTAELCGRESVKQTGLADKAGSWSPFPNIEVAVGPDVGTLNGIFVVDGVIIPGGYVDRPVEIEIQQGCITEIKGGRSAQKFSKLLAFFNCENIYNIVEIGIGCNPNSEFGKGSMGEDESKFGTLHLGIGEGNSFGVSNTAPAHLDLVIRKPRVEIDGRLILADEKLQI